MNKPFLFAALLLALLLGGSAVAVRAQYNPPPPPEQQNTGEPPDAGQPAPPPEGYNGGQPDQAPPPDQAPSPDQGGDQGAPPPDGASDGSDANFQTFYDNLSSQGNWVQSDNYGYVWQPNVQDPDWRPYSAGHWVYTDEGWTWVADESEPWGWATYHYGRWANIDGYGWVWVPGYTWAPAWVSWRYGGGYCGWAPLPPVTFIGVDFGGGGFGFHIGGDCDTAYGIGPGYYNFISVGFLGSRDYRHHYADRNNNFTIINNTRNVTNININNQRGAGRFSRVSVGGPNIATINAQSSTPVQRVQLSRSNRVGDASLSGNRLSVFAPHVNAASSGSSFRPRSVAATVGTARVNTGTNISQPLQVNSRVHAPGASPAQVAAARNVHFSSNARVAGPSVHPSTTLTRPLSSYQPHESRRTAATGTSSAAAPVNRTFSPAASTPRENSYTGEGNSEVRHATTSNSGESPTTARHDEEEAPHHTTSSAVTPQVQHSAASSESEVVHHPETEVRPQAEEHHEEVRPQEQHEEVRPQVQEQHQDFHPAAAPQQESHPQMEHHDAAPPQQHASAPSGGGGGNHPSGNGGGGDGKKDDKQQQH